MLRVRLTMPKPVTRIADDAARALPNVSRIIVYQEQRPAR